MKTTRIAKRFTALKAEGRKGLVIYTMAGDPDLNVSQILLEGLPAAGADFIELGVPFTDSMADGPSIQQAAQRALQNGQSLKKTIEMVRLFRQKDDDTPIILMGYYNPIYAYGVRDFLAIATDVGIDGLIVVDLPPEEDEELCQPARAAGLDFIRLLTPTTDAKRLPDVLVNTSGFLYYVSIAGITGTASADIRAVSKHLEAIRPHTALPIAIGFGVKSPNDVATMAQVADAVVVGSAVVDKAKHARTIEDIYQVHHFVSTLAAPLKQAPSKHTESLV